MLKLVLSNNTEINVKDGSTIFDIAVNPDQYMIMWENLVDSNLKVVKIMSENGELIDQLSDLAVDHEMSVIEKGGVFSHFYLREKNEVELLREQVAYLETQLVVHDGAINDLGAAVSSIAEEGGLA